MITSRRGSPRSRAILWLALLTFFVHASGAAADDCERMTDGGATRDCTFTEEMRQCWDDANHALDDCLADADLLDGWFERGLGHVGCAAGFTLNVLACGVSVTTDWLF